MEWWQILLIGVASLVVGISLGALLDYLLKRFAKKREPTLVIEEQLKYTPPDLLEEIENNYKIATEPWTSKLLPFQTCVWDTHQGEVNELPANLREDLMQLYIDIRLANSIVRLSTEFNHRTNDLNGSYMRMCASIAGRLDRIKPLIERLGK